MPSQQKNPASVSSQARPTVTRRRTPELGRLLQWEGLTSAPAADAGLDSVHLVFALIALAAWWQTVPQLAELTTGVSGDDVSELARRRAFVIAAARRLAAAR